MSAREALARFVVRSKDLSPVAADWSARRWRLRDGRSTVTFSMAARGPGKDRDFDGAFGEFARGVVAHLDWSRREVPSRGLFDSCMCALRCLHAAFEADGGGPADPARLTGWQFQAALTGIRARRRNDNNYRSTVSVLRQIATLVDLHGLADVGTVAWSPVVLDRERNAVGQPTLDLGQFEALATLSSRDDLPYSDRLRRCLVDVELLTGFRLSEALTLPADAWVEQEILDDDGELVLAPDGRAALHHGLRYWPRKGEDEFALVRPLPSAAVPTVTRAVDRALELTAEARRVAAHQESNPGSTSLGEPWDDMPGERLLSEIEVAAALGLADAAASRNFLKYHRVPRVRTEQRGRSGNPARYHVAKRDLYALLYRISDRKPPIDRMPDIPLSDMLFVVHRNCRGEGRGIRGTAMLMRKFHIEGFLKGHGTAGRSVWERLELAGIAVRSHQFRATLGTMGLEVGVGEMVTARWMGRKTVEAAADYDRRTGAQKAAALRAALEVDGEFAPSAAIVPLPLRDGEEVLQGGATAHATGIGMCHREYADEPCAYHRRLVEGGYASGWDPFDEGGAIANVVEQVERQLAQDERAAATGAAGAAAWVEAHRRELDALRRRLEGVRSVGNAPCR